MPRTKRTSGSRRTLGPGWLSRSVAQALVAASGQAEPAAVAAATAKSFVDDGISELIKDAPAWLRRTDFEWDITKSQQPEFSLLTVQPIYQSSGDIDTVFVQGRLAYGRGERTTGNLGLGYRRLVWNNAAMLGANAFYDYEWPYTHARAGIGAEIRSGPVELNSNYYRALSGRAPITATTIERALDGYDFELGVQFPYLPWARVFGRRFHWEAKDGPKDIDGQRLALRLQPALPFEIEAGIQDDNVTKSAYFVQIRVSLALGSPKPRRALPLLDSSAFRAVNMREDALEPVRRENTIRVEQTTTSGTASVTISRGT